MVQQPYSTTNKVSTAVVAKRNELSSMGLKHCPVMHNVFVVPAVFGKICMAARNGHLERVKELNNSLPADKKTGAIP